MACDFKKKLMGLPGILAICILLLDQLTKWLAIWLCPVPGERQFEVINGILTLVHWRNLGAAWGIAASHTFLLAIFSLAACILLIVFFRKLSEDKIPSALACGSLLGGMAGNFIDRAFYRDGVVDFIFVHYYDTWTYPAFNIADSAICCSVAFLLLYAIWQELPWNKRKTTEQS